MDGAPWDYGLELIPPDVDRISDELAMAMSRYPVLERTGINRWVNGAFTFSPDGNPLVGPVPGLRNYWSACAVMAGFLQGGGVGKSLAEWMIHGEPEEDIFGMDVARFGSFAENREYIRQMTGQFYSRRFVMTYPNEQLWGGRPLRMAPAYDAMTAAGAHWGSSYGLEVPIYFAPREFSETPTLRRSNAFDIVGEECRQVRSGVGILDISGFSRYEVTGPGAERWLDHLLTSRLPAPGRIRLSPMLGHDGRLKGDLTLLNWGDGTWWIMGSYYLRAWHMRWFNQHLTEGVSVRDISDGVVGFSLSGPKSRDLLQRVTDSDVSPAGPALHELSAHRRRADPGPGRSDFGHRANWASRFIARPPSMSPCAACWWKREQTSVRSSTGTTPSFRCGWRRASESGRPSTARSTRRG